MAHYPRVNASEVLTVATNVSAACRADGATFLHTGTGRLFTANHVGARVWTGIERHLTPCDIAAEIAREYALPPSAAREHVDAFLTELVRHQLVHPEIGR